MYYYNIPFCYFEFYYAIPNDSCKSSTFQLVCMCVCVAGDNVLIPLMYMLLHS